MRLMVLELPTTLMDMSKMDNTMVCLMRETINNMMLELYASMAQAEIEKKEKRQREGIEMKKRLMISGCRSGLNVWYESRRFIVMVYGIKIRLIMKYKSDKIENIKI